MPDGRRLLIGNASDLKPAELIIKDTRFFQCFFVYGDFGPGMAYEKGFWEARRPESTLEWFRQNTILARMDLRSHSRSNTSE